jgi:hypothetical protein
VTAVLGLIGVQISNFDMPFQQHEHFVSESREFLGNGLKSSSISAPWNSIDEDPVAPPHIGPIRRPLPFRLCRHSFVDARCNHLRDVATAERDALANKP